MLLYQMHLHKIPVNFFSFFEEVEEEEIRSAIKLCSVNKILRHSVDYHKNNYLDLSVVFFKTKTNKY